MKQKPSYICVGVPHFLGGIVEGRNEVSKIRNSGIAEELGAEWIDLQADFTSDPDPVIAVNRALAQVIKNHIESIPLVFAADCTSCFGALKGLEAQQPAILWYDAHGDFNTEETTPSGFLGGMPLAKLVGRGDLRIMEGVRLAPVAEADVIITDARDLDPEEGRMLAQSRITHLPRVEQLLHQKLPDKHLYIHFDTDVVDISEMPGMNYPAPGGPSLNTTLQSLQRVQQDTQIAGVLFSLWDDRHPTEGKSLTATLACVRAVTGI